VLTFLSTSGHVFSGKLLHQFKHVKKKKKTSAKAITVNKIFRVEEEIAQEYCKVHSVSCRQQSNTVIDS